MASVFEGSRDDDIRSEEALKESEATALAKIRLFRELSDSEVDELVTSSTSHRARKQQVVFSEGENLSHLYVVQSGSFKLVRHSEEGKELIMALVGLGDAFGALAQPFESACLAQALEPSEFLIIPLQSIRRLIARNPDFASSLIAYSEARQRKAQTVAARLAFETVPQRLANLLLDETGPTGNMDFPLNQTELANLIGSSRETVCSILNQFQRNALLTLTRGRIRILDRSSLGSIR